LAAEVELGGVGPVFTSRDGTHLHWRAWPRESPKLAVAIAHGLGDHSGRYERLAEALNRRNFSCYAVDLRGAGQSPGRRGHVSRWQQWVDDYAAFWELVGEEASGLEVVPLGHSLGGIVVASAMVRGAIAPQRFVLCNPAFRPALTAPAWKRKLGRAASGVWPALSMSNEVDPALLSRDAAEVAAYREDPLVHDRISSRMFTEWMAASEEALERAGEITAPLFLVLSDGDRIVDPGGGREFAERVGGGRTVRGYRGRYHEPFNDLGSEEVFADLAVWLDQSLPAHLNDQA
jgi:alpha-beta hydrolase superfamily lysophospholipase